MATIPVLLITGAPGAGKTARSVLGHLGWPTPTTEPQAGR